MIAKAQVAKTKQIKTKTCGPYQTKSSAQQRKQNYKMKRQPKEWENIFSNHISDKEYYPKISMAIKNQLVLAKIREEPE